MPTGLKIALLGAESTGKTALAAGLASHAQQAGRTAIHIPEVLREWCAREGRTPRPDEQEAIARAQIGRVVQATDVDWVISDTTPLMTAIYSEMLFGDTSLYPLAFEHQRNFDVTLITGLDLPWVADGLQRDGPHVREPVDSMLRSALALCGVSFRVVYGRGPERLANALAAIEACRPQAVPRWTGLCERCGDPDCEHRIFTGRRLPEV